jgi:RNA polymerase sigma factor (sigma-70 family)
MPSRECALKARLFVKGGEIAPEDGKNRSSQSIWWNRCHRRTLVARWQSTIVGVGDFENDAILVANLVLGKPEAWKEFVERYQSFIYAVIRNKDSACTDADLQDRFQQIMLKIIEKDFRVLRIWEGRGALKNYLALVVGNFVTDLLRKSSRQKHESVEEGELERLLGEAENPEQRLKIRQAFDCYARCLGQLTSAQLEIVRLHSQDLSYAKIAKKKNISVSYVGVRLSEIRAKLKKLIEKNCPDLADILIRYASVPISV